MRAFTRDTESLGFSCTRARSWAVGTTWIITQCQWIPTYSFWKWKGTQLFGTRRVWSIKTNKKKSAWNSICKSVTEGYESKCAQEKEKICKLLLMYDVLNKLVLLSSEHYPSLLLSIQQQPVICSLTWSRTTTSHSSVRTNLVFFYSTFWIRTIGSRPCENSLKVQIAIPMTARRNRSSLSMHTIELDSSPKAKIFYNSITPMLHQITTEPNRTRTLSPQRARCQQFYHVAVSCQHPPPLANVLVAVCESPQQDSNLTSYQHVPRVRSANTAPNFEVKEGRLNRNKSNNPNQKVSPGERSRQWRQSRWSTPTASISQTTITFKLPPKFASHAFERLEEINGLRQPIKHTHIRHLCGRPKFPSVNHVFLAKCKCLLTNPLKRRPWACPLCRLNLQGPRHTNRSRPKPGVTVPTPCFKL
jgi:hypothetical protein